jgi:hypothetical protein
MSMIKIIEELAERIADALTLQTELNEVMANKVIAMNEELGELQADINGLEKELGNLVANLSTIMKVSESELKW